jgi:hypothetical protein
MMATLWTFGSSTQQIGYDIYETKSGCINGRSRHSKLGGPTHAQYGAAWLINVLGNFNLQAS